MNAVLHSARAADRLVVSGAADRVLSALRQAPYKTAADLIGGGGALVVAPHADDETLGCGGLILAARRDGVAVLIDILTDGARSHPGSILFPPTRLAALRREEARQAVVTLGVPTSALLFHDHPDGYLGRDESSVRESVLQLAHRIDSAKVTAVFVTSAADPHPDHAAAFALARRAVALSSMQPSLYAYPIWAWTETGEVELGADALAAYRVDIASDLALKRRAVDCYASQLGRAVPDSPDGFRLTAAHLDLFVGPDETFVKFAS